MKLYGSDVNLSLKQKNYIFSILGIAIVVLMAFVPLFFSLPFRDNIYLSWEGAYRMYNGQMPFRDFGIPMGYGYWLLPTLSFYVFGPYFSSLVKIQVLINILSGFSFFLICRKLSSSQGLSVLMVFLYVISFSFYNFWPWYNHTVIVYEFISLALLLLVIFREKQSHWLQYVLIVLSALFSFLSIFTKQDGGAFAIMIAIVLLLYHGIAHRQYWQLMLFLATFFIIACVFIIPLLNFDFSYWFNFGQAPHYSRVSVLDLLTALFEESEFIKLYLILIVIILVSKCREGFKWLLDKRFVIHLLLSCGILIQATVLQVTSYVPVDSNVYYHSFLIFFILSHLDLKVNFNNFKTFTLLGFVLFIWWSRLYWNYSSRMFPEIFAQNEKTENIISKSTFALGTDTTLLDKSVWVIPNYKAFEGIRVPQEVNQAIDTLKDWRSRQMDKPRVLNMSELSPLAKICDFDLEKGLPLWYHLNVAMFDKELQVFKNRIHSEYYDMVIYEYIPHLNNFYPFEIREALKSEYKLWFSFQAPRENTTEIIEVYLKNDEKN